MSGWILAGGLALAAFLAVALLFKAPRRSWEAVAAALVLGIAGYARQASPDQPGAPKDPAEAQGDGSAIVSAQQALADRPVGAGDRNLVFADAFMRNGQFADAAEVLRGAVKNKPDDGEAWLALANALMAHAEGSLTPAALYAFDRAADAAPQHPGPPFFLGLALATNGRLAEARAIWADLLQHSPPDASWRDDLTKRLAQLDALIAEQGQAQPQ